jgi:uncharacterized membrane protein YfcA
MLQDAVAKLSVTHLIAVTAILIVSGSVKGLLGVGLPLTAVPLLTQVLELPKALALLTVPLFASNVSQAVQGGRTVATVRRLLPVIVPLIGGTVLGARLLVSIDHHLIYGIVGASLILLAAAMLAKPKYRLPDSMRWWAGPCAGLVSGVLGGMAALSGPPLVFYLIGLGLEGRAFVKEVSILLTAAMVTLALTLGGSGQMDLLDLAISLCAMVPIFFGMRLGAAVRSRIPPYMFRVLVLAVVTLSGAELLHKAFG